MIKRISANLFILCASIFLLAHAVIPHMHSICEVIIITPFDHQQKESHNHNIPGHNHDCNDHSANCILQQVIIVRDSDPKKELIFSVTKNKKDDFFGHPDLLGFTDSFYFQFPQFEPITPYFISFSYAQTITDNFNSRGSPIV